MLEVAHAVIHEQPPALTLRLADAQRRGGPPDQPLGRLVEQPLSRPVGQPQRAAAMPLSAEYLRVLRRCGIAAVLSGAGPAVIALSTSPGLPAAALEYGAANGFTVSKMTIGDGVRWTSGVAVRS